MQPDDKFCDQCGTRVPTAPSQERAFEASATPPQDRVPEPPPPTPPRESLPETLPGPPIAPSRKGSGGLLVALLLGLLALGMGLLAVRFLPTVLASGPGPNPIPAEPSLIPPPIPTPASSTPTASLIPPTGLTVPTPSSTPTALNEMEAFTGAWVTDSGTIIELALQGDTLVGKSSVHSELRLSRLDPADAVLHGSYTEDNGTTIPATAELSAERLVLTLAPPQSEFHRVVLKRSQGGAPLRAPLDARACVPTPHTLQSFQARYPDGDSGTIEARVEAEDGSVVSVTERATSKLYPGEPTVTVQRYIEREDGIHRVSERSDQLWLPSRLELGASWRSQGWDCRLIELQSPLDLGFLQLDCLVVERENSAVQVRETIWIAPGYGEVRVEMGKGMETRRLTSVQKL